jgi:hypothetical protein
MAYVMPESSSVEVSRRNTEFGHDGAMAAASNRCRKRMWWATISLD